jgi:hypothetical protein
MARERRKIEGHSDFVKDPNTGAVLNINTTKADKARLAKKKKREKAERLEKLEGDVAQMKYMLEKLTEKLG